MWQEPADALYAGGPSLAALALLTNEATADLPAAVGRFANRLRADSAASTPMKDVANLSFVLCGLRYPTQQIARLFMGLRNILKESSTYQMILSEGRTKGKVEGKAEGAIEGERKLLLITGRKRLGDPSPQTEAAITDPARLERMAERILDAAGWDDLLATP